LLSDVHFAGQLLPLESCIGFTLRMASHSDMSDLLVIFAECDESESSSSCCTCTTSQHSPASSHEVESSEVETLFCQCNNEDALMECLTCGSGFELDTFCPGC
jgi:hypothetical protein